MSDGKTYSQRWIKSKSIKSCSLHNPLPLERHAYVLQYAPVYAVWLWVYLNKYSDWLSDSPELATFSLLVVVALNALLLLSTAWSVSAKAWLTTSTASHPRQARLVKIIPIEHSGAGDLATIHRRRTSKENSKDSTGDEEEQLYFIFQKRKFVFNPDSGMFEKLKYPSKMGLTMAHFKSTDGLVSSQQVDTGLDTYGPNKFEIPIPSFQELFKEQAVAPFFVFQLFCVSLWFLDEMWYYSIFTVVMLVVFESTVVFQRLKNLQEFRSMSTKPYPIFAYRSKQWTLAQTDHLVPGDVVSVVRTKDEGEALPVPADMLILQGSCIANEAMLSGESTPQLKESVWLREDGDVLNIDADKGSVVFGGTKVLQVSPPKYQNDTSTTAPTGAGFGGGTEEDSDFPVNWRIPKSPDGGCIATVLRTGFSTQQGKLVRMIIYSTERITANNLESLLFILFLLFFAIIAAGYVWNEGINNPNRKQSKVLLDCILIITSVVPPELPMELSLAVNNSLIALARGYIFCTEPFRIPFAGKIDVACFDKTGTITQENLIVQGLIGVSNKSSLTPSKSSSDNAENCLVKATKIPKETTFVLACAHALVHLDEPIIEPAAVEEEEKGKIESSSSSKITSSSSSSKSKSSSNKNIIGDPMEKNTLDAIDWLLQKGDILSPNNTAGSAINPAIVRNTQIRILRRFAFSSTLKRMSTVSFVNEGGNPSSKLFVAVKGAPETIQGMLTSVPADYEAMYKQWARQGSRVLALGYKWLNNNVRIPHVHDLVRDDVESELTFGGFLIFSCPLKKDSASAIKALNESSHRVVMITGDNALTAVHVAREVEIVKREVLIADVWDESKGLEFRSIDESKSFTIDVSSAIPSEKKILDYDLCITGRGLVEVIDTPSWTGYLLPRLWVYARVSPSQKESILMSLKSAGYSTLMCGDGTNDVGALKQSHVGIALLDGNIEDMEKLAARFRIKRQQQMIAQQEMLRQKWGLDKLEQSAAGGPAGAATDPTILKRKKAEEEMKKKLSSMLDDLGDEPPTIKFGDASVAAPFTSKISSLSSVTQIVRQGRSTLVAMVQMYKILALNCLISAYSMSVMYLAGIKQGDWQATIAGLLITMCFFGIAKSSAVEKLSKKRPQANVFNFYIILSVLGQAAIHVASLAYIRQEAIKFSEELEEDIDLDAKFQPNILNSGVYLVTLIMQISTFAINYQGLPFRESLRENKALWNSLLMTSAIAILAATEISTDLNDWMQLVPFPDEFRYKLIATMVLDFGLAWLVEQIVSSFFSDNKPKESLLLD